MSVCGNGQIDPGEDCDSTNFGDATCQSEGLGPGALKCNTFCHVDVSDCVVPENCYNGLDDDGNGLIDCNDPACVGQFGCVDSCMPTYPIAAGDSPMGDTTNRPNTMRASCSSAMSGNEQIYRLVAPSTGTLGLFLNLEGSQFSVSVRTSCDDDGSELGCSSAPNKFSQVTLGVPVTMGQTYYVVVDGMTSGDLGPFYLVTQMLTPEVLCNDDQDDDLDGRVDCDDPDCQSSSWCQPGAAPAGQTCSANTDCFANHNDPICLSGLNYSQFPNNYCSEFCDTVLQDCAAGSLCYAGFNLSTDGICLQTCTVDSDCRTADGYACTEAGLDSKVCIVPPETDCTDHNDNDDDFLTDCADPSSCQSQPACTPGATPVGQPCTQHSDCVASAGVNNPFCFDEAHEGFSNGYCSHFCDPSAPGDCDANSVCTYGPVGGSVCMATCTSDADCRTAEGYTCQTFNFPPVSYCYPGPSAP